MQLPLSLMVTISGLGPNLSYWSVMGCTAALFGGFQVEQRGLKHGPPKP